MVAILVFDTKISKGLRIKFSQLLPKKNVPITVCQLLYVGKLQ